MTKQEALEELFGYDHAIISEDRAMALAAPFGLTQVPTRDYATNPAANNGKGVFMEKEGPAVSAHELAEAIADHMGLTYPPMMGLGSRLRVACSAIQQAIKSDA